MEENKEDFVEMPEQVTSIVVNKTIDENPDSLELSTPAKGGAIKCYGNFNNPEAFKVKIDNAIAVRAYAQEKMGIQQ